MSFSLEVLYEDNHLLVVSKPAGLLTQPNETNEESLEAYAKDWIKTHYNKPGAVFLHAVHRLDKPVSGVVVFARTSKALSRLNEAFRGGKTSKTYVAVVEGNITPKQGTLEHYLIHDDYQAQIVGSSHPQAKKARLSYNTLQEKPGFSFLEIQLETGRYHQIRVQFSSWKHPILGDSKYGSKHPYKPQAIALHHSTFECPHPIGGALLKIEAPLPKEWPSF